MKKISLNTKDMQNLKAYLGFYANVMRVIKEFFPFPDK